MTVLPFEHADEAAAALREIVAEQGTGVLSDPLMLGSLLADLLPSAPNAVRVLVAAAEDRVADSIKDNVSQGISADAAVRMAATSFARTSLSAPEVSQWVATAFASASGLPTTPSVPSAPGAPSGYGSGGQANSFGQLGTAPNWPASGQSAPTMQSGPQAGFQQGQQAGFQPPGTGIPPASPQIPSPYAYSPYQPYQPYQASNQVRKQQFAPATVRNAVKLMYGGIAASAILAIIDFAEVGSLQNNNFVLTPHQSSVATALSFGAFISVFGVGFWILLAWANRRGMPWARIVSTVLLGIFVLYTLVSIVDVTAAAIIFELATIGVGLASVMQLWKSESSAFYQLPPTTPVQ
ncbi:MAG TPA: hypothetical protein VMA95_15140 [Streptosporangiaceae bacterium]|nr:hypothetical protein [Streptosporangiaceae bacterium]